MSQILRLNVFKRRGGVELLSAGEPQLVTCAPIVYLSATVIGGLLGHTTEWVQISGTPSVDIEVVDELNAYYMVDGNVGSDKLFRFYIDKDTQIEQYMDVLIQTTPTDNLYSFSSAYVINDTITDPIFFINDIFLSNDFVFDGTIPFNSEGRYLTDDPIIEWGLPQAFYEQAEDLTHVAKSSYSGSIVQFFDGSSWQDLVIKGREEVRQRALNNEDRLRVGAIFNFSGKGQQVVYSQWFDTSSFASSVISAKEVMAGMDNSPVGNDVTIHRLIYTLVILEPTDDINALSLNAVTNDSTVGRIVYSIVPIPADDDFLGGVEASAITNNFTITRVSGSSVGG